MAKVKRRTLEQVYALWIKALRSGDYEQTDGQLKNEYSNSFCCLGVLCDLAAKDGGEKWTNWGTYGENHDTDFLPTHMRRYIKMCISEQRRLVEMNDGGRSFENIASEIEKIRDKAIRRKSVF